MRATWAWCLALQLGCGRIDFGARTSDARLAPTTADATTDSAAAGACGTTIALQDDFTATTAGPEWSHVSASDIVISQGGGTLVATFAATTAADESASYTQIMPIDFRGGCLTVKIVAVPDASVSAAYAFILMATGSVGVGFEPEVGTLAAMFYTDLSTATNVTVHAFDPVADELVRLRENGGTYFWETSADGVTFVPYGSASATGVDASSLGVWIGAATNTSTATNAGTASYGPLVVMTP